VDERRVLLLLLVLTGAGCAELSEQSSEARAERVYRTGSNIPVHDRNSKGEVLTLDRDSVEEMMRHTSRQPSNVGGH
jgi:hypothetical protein